jgi:AsmA-like C-terminal region
MTPERRSWLVTIAVAAGVLAGSLAIGAAVLSARLEPDAREAAIRYLSQRFDSDVQLRALHLRLTETSLLRLILARGRGLSGRIEGEGLSLRMKGQVGAGPLLSIQKFRGDVNVESLLHPPVVVSEILVDGMELEIPPRNEQAHPQSSADVELRAQQSTSYAGVIIEEVRFRNAALVLQPKNPQRFSLRFDIQNLQLESAGRGMPWKYDATLTNAKPPGDIHATGTFGPWVASEPGGTLITGNYLFENANLGVFAGIEGTLRSTGRFEGPLSALRVKGEASVPDFRLRMTGTPVPLFARFTALVDGSNGNTTLEPVEATLGTTNFTTSGAIIRHEANQPRAVSLDVAMPNGDLRDVLRLAMRGAPFMEGRLVLNTKLDIPPLTGKVKEKLELDGSFKVLQGKFLNSTIQTQIEGLSKRAQGQLQTPASDQAVSQMTGVFHMENATIRFRELSFGIPGAGLDLAGNYNLDSDSLDFGGTLKLQATVSQLVTGRKRSILRVIDPFFEKEGAGTFLRIRIGGTSKAPRFGVILAGKKLELALPKR